MILQDMQTEEMDKIASEQNNENNENNRLGNMEDKEKYKHQQKHGKNDICRRRETRNIMEHLVKNNKGQMDKLHFEQHAKQGTR